MLHVLLDIGIDAASLARLRRLSGIELLEVEIHHKPTVRPAELLRRVEVLVCKHPPVNFDDLTGIKLIQLASVGYDHLAHLNLAGHAITVCNARGLFDTGIAEWTVAMMVNLVRDVRGMIRNQERGHWDRGAAFQQEIRGLTLGLWGYGGLARETARLAKAMGLRLHVLTRRGVRSRGEHFTLPGTGDPEGKLPDQEFVAGQEREFLAGLDFLVVAVPRTQATTGMIGESELRALKKTSFVLNPARGPIIQEAALLRALTEGWIAGAALDTHHHYPMPPEHPLWRMPNVILTPHIAGADRSTRFPALMGELCLENLTRFRDSRPLLNTVTADELLEI
jgi:phosphoglycerate dehydrogenase-like enzyme